MLQSQSRARLLFSTGSSICATVSLHMCHCAFAHVRDVACNAQNRLFTLQRDQEAAAVGDDGEADLAAAEVDQSRNRLDALQAEKEALVAQVKFLGFTSLKMQDMV